MVRKLSRSPEVAEEIGHPILLKAVAGSVDFRHVGLPRAGAGCGGRAGRKVIGVSSHEIAKIGSLEGWA